MIARRPWTGYGYESFWGTMFVMTMDQPFDRDWDIRGIVHGHNGYLDIAVIMGLPALVAAIVAFLIVPLVDYLRSGLPRDAYARARVNRMGRRYASVHVEAWQDNRARLFAQATLGIGLLEQFLAEVRHFRSGVLLVVANQLGQ